MLIQDRIAPETNVPEEVACLFVTKSLDPLFFRQPISSFVMVFEAIQLLPEL